MLQARLEELLKIQSACVGGRKERRETTIDQTAFFFKNRRRTRMRWVQREKAQNEMVDEVEVLKKQLQ